MKKQSKYIPEETLFNNLENFRSIDMEKDWQNIKERIGFKKRRSVNLIWRAAAMFIVLLGVGFLAKQYVFKTPELLLASTQGKQEGDPSIRRVTCLSE